MNKQKILNYLKEKSQEFYNLSDQIWDNAEICLTEYKSAKALSGYLESEGFQVVNDVAGLKTGFYAKWGQGNPVIGFLGEYDALPNLSQKAGIAVKEPDLNGTSGHGCGHNLLGVGSLIGAVGLKKYLEEEDKPGTVVYFGCPAEECGGGKVFMAREGLFDGLDCAFSWHPASVTGMSPGSFLANIIKRYSFTGVSAHAANCPELGRSALDALELMNIGIQFLREHVPTTTRIHYAITDAGGRAANIVQAYAEGFYEIRALHGCDVQAVVKRLDDIAAGAALMTGTTVKSEVLEGTSDTILIPALDEVMDRNLREIHSTALEASDMDLAWDIVKTQCLADKMPSQPFDGTVYPYNKKGDIPVAGSSDTGDVSWICPLSQCGVSTWPVGTAAHSWQAVASGKSDFAHRGMFYAGQVLAATSIDVYENPEIIAQAKKQLTDKKNGQTYHCPIPQNVTPEWLVDILR